MDEQIAYFRALIAQNPDHVDAHLKLALLWRRSRRRTEAISAYTAAAELLASKGSVLKAIGACRAILEMDPSNTDAKLMMARLYAQQPARNARVVEVIEPPSLVEEEEEEPELIVLSAADAVNEIHSTEIVALDRPEVRTPRPVEPIGDGAVAQPDVHLAVTTAQPALSRQTAQRDVHREVTVARAAPVRPVEPATERPTVEAVKIMRSEPPPPAEPRYTPIPRPIPDDDEDAVVLDGEELASMLESIDDVSFVEDMISDGPATSDVPEPELEALIQDSIFSALGGGQEQAVNGSTTSHPFGRPGPASLPNPNQMVSVDAITVPPSPLFERLPQGTLDQFIEDLQMRRVRRSQCIINENVHHHGLFVLVKGLARVERRTRDGIEHLSDLNPGDFFGEFEVLTGKPPKVSVRAIEEVTVLELPQRILNRLAKHDPTIWQVLWTFYHQRLLNNLMVSSKLFSSLNSAEREVLSQEFTRVELNAGQLIVRQGQPAQGLYLLARGELVLEKAGQVEPLATLGEGDFFGTIFSVGRTVASASARATADSTLLLLRRARLTSLIQRHPQIDVELRRLVLLRPIFVGQTS